MTDARGESLATWLRWAKRQENAETMSGQTEPRKKSYQLKTSSIRKEKVSNTHPFYEQRSEIGRKRGGKCSGCSKKVVEPKRKHVAGVYKPWWSGESREGQRRSQPDLWEIGKGNKKTVGASTSLREWLKCCRRRNGRILKW